MEETNGKSSINQKPMFVWDKEIPVMLNQKSKLAGVPSTPIQTTMKIREMLSTPGLDTNTMLNVLANIARQSIVTIESMVKWMEEMETLYHAHTEATAHDLNVLQVAVIGLGVTPEEINQISERLRKTADKQSTTEGQGSDLPGQQNP
jgi:predicted lactoylglutathione lyase